VKRTLLVLGYVVGAFFIVRAVVEPFTINVGDSASHEQA